MKRGYEVYFDTIIKISKYNLRSVSRGCIEDSGALLTAAATRVRC